MSSHWLPLHHVFLSISSTSKVFLKLSVVPHSLHSACCLVLIHHFYIWCAVGSTGVSLPAWRCRSQTLGLRLIQYFAIVDGVHIE